VPITTFAAEGDADHPITQAGTSTVNLQSDQDGLVLVAAPSFDFGSSTEYVGRNISIPAVGKSGSTPVGAATSDTSAIEVHDYRGTASGWKVGVAATPLQTNDTTPIVLPLQSTGFTLSVDLTNNTNLMGDTNTQNIVIPATVTTLLGSQVNILSGASGTAATGARGDVITGDVTGTLNIADTSLVGKYNGTLTYTVYDAGDETVIQ
jgi:hypothetical protein